MGEYGQQRRYLAGPEARQIVADHDERHRAAVEEAMRVVGILDASAGGEITWVTLGSRFYGYKPSERLPLVPGFRLDAAEGIAVPNKRTEEGRRAAAALGSIRIPTAEDLTKALCGEPWCAAAGRPDGRMSAWVFLVERVDEHVIIVGRVGGHAPRGCVPLPEPDPGAVLRAQIAEVLRD